MAFWNREKISYDKLNQMVDEAMDGSFSEESYTESELSKLERMLMEADKEGIKDMMRRSTARRKLFDKEPPATKEKEE